MKNQSLLKTYNKSKKIQYIIFMALILFIIGILLLGSTLARYIKEGTGEDSARIAKWSVCVTDEMSGAGKGEPARDQSTTKTIIFNDQSKTADYNFTAQNKKFVNNSWVTNETSAKYEIELRLPKAGVDQSMPYGTSISLKQGGTTYKYPEISSTDTYTSYKWTNNNWVFNAAQEEEQEFVVQFGIDQSCTQNVTLNGFSVYVNYSQIN